MMSKFRASRERDERGFTLIELLVVILIIAILAAIAIPVFLNQREKGWVSQTESALKNAATAAESYATGNNGSYAALTHTATDTATTADSLTAEGYNATASVTLTIQVSATDYCIQATHAQLGAEAPYSISSSSGVPAEGGCPTL